MKIDFDIHGGNVDKVARELGLNSKTIIDASASIAPFKLPKKLTNYLNQSIKNGFLKFYPDRSYFEVKNAISTWHNIDPEMILPGNGASELFTWAAREASLKGISSLPSPGFGDYKRALKCWNAPYIESPLPLYWSDKKPQSFPIKPKTNVLWITNPHNPTGQLWSRSSIENLLANYQLVICDEAFISIVPGGENQSIIDLTKSHKNLIVIRSLTKLFGIAGLRIGYAITNADRLLEWCKVRDPWPVNILAINATNMIMKDSKIHKKRLNKIHRWVEEEGNWLNQSLLKFSSLSPLPSTTNFQLIKSKNSVLSLLKNLKKRGILLRDCRSFNNLGENWFRISLQKRKQNIQIINTLKDYIN
ncbi:pyridoxal phosphate-dependent aminotransferase [Prochlorococcus marinus]|uniref:Aminotransferase n=1 Tax=Prochlorococcus marinus XMU1408 TaxID=2213228 RepID=A0A318RD40_PROMR|nr:histidinol-phosphate transaminase [Prochlorococcus marinus]MBW3041259.1 threonine-phosphate decarboxylase [Prochlorococcus marinus str. XMU1408]PYE03848.1 threonine-phosphate decarboxylase [Prochlorococcus marinus XMU1408]